MYLCIYVISILTVAVRQTYYKYCLSVTVVVCDWFFVLRLLI